MSENIDINVALINEEITISAVNNLNEVVVNAVSNTEDINVTANTNLIQVNINTAPLSIINPQDYDLSQFTNTSSNPFVQQSGLASYVPIYRTIKINGVLQDLSADREWNFPVAVWGSITGTLSAQTDLVAALAAKQDTLTLTTTGSSGAATLVGATLNIPNYTISGLGGVPSSRTLTINGTTYDLSADRTWTIATGLTVGTTPIASGVVGQILFQGAGDVLQESANFFWDNTNGRLGIGTNSPNVSLDARNGFNLYTSGAAPGSHYLEAFSTTSTDATLNFRRAAGANGLYRFTLTGAQLNSDNTTGECQLRAANSFFWSIYSNGSERVRIPLTGNILIGTTTDAGYKLDVNGTVRVQDVITGSVGGGSLTLGAVSANQPAIAVTGYFTALGAVNISNSNPRGYNVRLSAQGVAGFYSSVNSGDFQNFVTGINYFQGSGSIAVANAVSGSEINGYLFNPTITNQGLAFVAGFRSMLTSAANRWNLYIDGTASNYLASNLLINTTTDAGYKLDINGTSRFSGLTDFNADIVLNSNRIFMQSNSGNVLLRMVQTNNLQIYNNNSGATLYLNANGVVQIGQTNAVNWATFSASGHTIYGVTNTNFFSSGNIGVNTATDAGFKLDVNGTFRVSAADALSAFQITAPTRAWYFTTSAQGGTFNAISGSANGVAGSGNYGFVISNGWAFNIGLTTSQPDSLFSIYPTGTNQGEVRIGGQTGNSTSLLTLESTTKGFLPPRMSTTQKNAIATPATGLVVFDTTLNALSSFNGTVWSTIGGSVAWGSITGTLSTQTDLQSALDTKVPYTGAVNNVNLGEYGLTAGQLTLDTTPTGTAVVGTTQWNDAIGSSQTTLKGGTVILKNGVDLVARVVNKVTPSATLTRANYTAVRVSGAQGQRLAVAYAQANTDNNSADTIGLVVETIATNQEGFVMTVGQLTDVDTTGSLQGETWADGDVLYLSPTTPGALTNIKPTGLTGHIVVMGYVEYAHAVHGSIYVKIMNGWELDELHNVYINSGTLANNNILQYDSADQLWKNESLSSAGVQPTITLTTTGTSGPATLVGSTLNIPQYGGGGGGGSIIKLASQTLAVGSWTLVGSYYQLTFSNVNITTNTRVDFTPDNSSYLEITTCGMLPEVDVAAGSCTFYSLFPPQTNINGEITIFPTI